MLAADGPAYKALIVDRVHVVSLDCISRLMEYAQAGLPIILYDSGRWNSDVVPLLYRKPGLTQR